MSLRGRTLPEAIPLLMGRLLFAAKEQERRLAMTLGRVMTLERMNYV